MLYVWIVDSSYVKNTIPRDSHVMLKLKEEGNCGEVAGLSNS